MKKVLHYSILIILSGCVAFTSCKKERPVSSIINRPPLSPPSLPVVFNPHLIPMGMLSKARSRIVVGAGSNKILFVGGEYGENCSFWDPENSGTGWIESICLSNSTRVDIYDTSAHTWSTHELERFYYASSRAVTVGSKIFFIGGIDTLSRLYLGKIDVYDALTNTWSVIQYSGQRYGMAVGTVGEKIFFAGGSIGNTSSVITDKVEIYDVASNTWSTDKLSEARTAITVISVGHKLIFAGGDYIGGSSPGMSLSNSVDIYDDDSKTWSHSTLSLARHEMSAFAIGNKAYFAGGNVGPGLQPPFHLDIYDAGTNIWSAKIMSLWISGDLPTVIAGNNAILVPGLGEMYVFNALTDTWSTFPFNLDLRRHSAVFSVGNAFYVVEGQNYAEVTENQIDRVWKLEF